MIKKILEAITEAVGDSIEEIEAALLRRHWQKGEPREDYIDLHDGGYKDLIVTKWTGPVPGLSIDISEDDYMGTEDRDVVSVRVTLDPEYDRRGSKSAMPLFRSKNARTREAELSNYTTLAPESRRGVLDVIRWFKDTYKLGFKR